MPGRAIIPIKDMETRGLIVGLIVFFLFIGGVFFWLSSGTKVSAVEPEIASISVERPNIVVEGKGLTKVEIWGVPTGTEVTEDAFKLLGEAKYQATNAAGVEIWIFPIPETPLLMTGLIAKGYGQDGMLAGQVSLTEVGATSVYNLLWATTTDSNASTTPPKG